jgi:GTP-binding protein
LTGRRNLARVGKTPGRTQQINFFAVGEDLILVDLPGYGFAKVPVAVKEAWRKLIEAYLRGRRQLRGVVVLVDSRRGVSDEDRELVEFLAAIEVPCCIAATKVDKLKRSERGKLLAELERALPVHSVVPCSATTGEGIGELWERIRALAD